MCSSTFEKVWRIDKEKHKILVVYNEAFIKKSASNQSKYGENPILWYIHYFRLYNIYKNQEINVCVIKDSSLKCFVSHKKASRRFGRKLNANAKIICPPEHPWYTHTFNCFDKSSSHPILQIYRISTHLRATTLISFSQHKEGGISRVWCCSGHTSGREEQKCPFLCSLGQIPPWWPL